MTDNACSLPEALVNQYEITVIPLYIQQGDNTYLDGVNLTCKNFSGFTTTAPSKD